MPTEENAVQTARVLRDEYGSDVLAVGWYDGTREDRTGAVFVSDRLDTEPADPDTVLEDALFQSLSRDLQERLHDETLRSTAHIYDSLIDINLPDTKHSGLVVALDAEAGEQVVNLVDFVHRSTPTDIGLEPDAA